MNIHKYWEAVLKQQAEEIHQYFVENAYVRWHNTNEHFSVDEFIIANCEYPGNWEGEVERIETIEDLTITVTHVYTSDKNLSFHVVSFIKVYGGKIVSIDEYWGDDGVAPQWRLDKHIGSAIK